MQFQMLMWALKSRFRNWTRFPFVMETLHSKRLNCDCIATWSSMNSAYVISYVRLRFQIVFTGSFSVSLCSRCENLVQSSSLRALQCRFADPLCVIDDSPVLQLERVHRHALSL
jgi:hypothetical protein